MQQRFVYLCAALMLTVMAGCAQRAPEPVALVVKPAETRWQDPKIWSPDDPSLQAVFAQIAQTAIGTPYVRGGTSTEGFDCSGFVQWAYRHMGVTLPRTAHEQSGVGDFVPKKQLQVGDIVAFRHPRRGYHTGIYMGEDRFVHSPSKRQQVRYSSLNEPYFRDTYIGARRVAVSKNVDIAAASRRMAELDVRKAAPRSDVAPVTLASVARGTGAKAASAASAATGRQTRTSKGKDASKKTAPKAPAKAEKAAAHTRNTATGSGKGQRVAVKTGAAPTSGISGKAAPVRANSRKVASSKDVSGKTASGKTASGKTASAQQPSGKLGRNWTK